MSFVRLWVCRGSPRASMAARSLVITSKVGLRKSRIIARRILSILTEFGCATSCFAETSPQFSFNSASRSLENSLKRGAIQSHIWIESPRQDRHKVKTGADRSEEHTSELQSL